MFIARKPLWLVVMLLLTTGTALMVWRSGHWLVHRENIEPMAWAVVLAGGTRESERTDAAARLYELDQIDTVVLSGVRMFKTRYSSEFLLPRLTAQGVPRESIFELRHDSYSTIEEARLIVQQLRLLNVDSVLIITSNYHSGRSRMIFNKISKGNPVVKVYGADFNGYDPHSWWSNRTSLKFYLLEMMKFFASFIELMINFTGSKSVRQAELLLLEPGDGLMERINPQINFEMKPQPELNTVPEPAEQAADTAAESIHAPDSLKTDTLSGSSDGD